MSQSELIDWKHISVFVSITCGWIAVMYLFLFWREYSWKPRQARKQVQNTIPKPAFYDLVSTCGGAPRFIGDCPHCGRTAVFQLQSLRWYCGRLTIIGDQGSVCYEEINPLTIMQFLSNYRSAKDATKTGIGLGALYEGRPLATAHHTVEELEEMGFKGLYIKELT